MNGADFGRAVVVGLIATFVATIFGYWEVALGLPKLDFATLLGQDLVSPELSKEFAYSVGMAQHFIDGVIFSLLFVRVFEPVLPGPVWLKGLLFGLLVWLGSGLVASPIHNAGFFWRRWLLPSFFGVLGWHIVWGLILGIALSLSRPRGVAASRC